MQDLFSSSVAGKAPLADRMRPRTLDEFLGQEHVVGKGRLLRRAIEADRLTSSIFYGPPGCGKTTLASIIAATTRSAFAKLNAVTSGVSDVRAVIKEAEERKNAAQSEKKGAGNWFLKKIRLVSDNVEKLANDFLADNEDNQ